LGKFRDKLIDWKKRLSDRHMYSVIVMLIAIVAILKKEYKQLMNK
jgi:spore germination protein